MRVKWFYATDVANTKPDWYNYTKEKEPQNFVAFKDHDNERLERGFGSSKDTTIEVNDDNLFEVNLKSLELSPIYWEGPTYEVRRGTWFSSNGIPLPNSISSKIEKGYLSKKPQLYPQRQGDFISKESIAKFNLLRKQEVLSDQIDASKESDILDLENGKLVLYFDATDAVIFPLSMNSFQLNVIRNFGAGASLLSVEYIQRGYTDKLDKMKLPSNPIPDVTDRIQKEVTSLLSLEKSDEVAQATEEHTILEADSKQDSSREIDHLVLCIHGIGQILGNKYESVNFTHSINVLRNTMKSVYTENAFYHKDGDKQNNKIQVLPISWRHKIDFHPLKPFEQFNPDGEYRLPSLSQINVDGVKPLRNILGDVVLDVLLYYEPLYVNSVFETVVTEVNRVYDLYMQRNPNFKGKIHVMGHSLGSAISFDILCNETRFKTDPETSLKLDFPVENLFCVGSPVGVFKLLEQKNIVGKSQIDGHAEGKFVLPNCKNIYNLFHPCDPVGYRMEPLVATEFSKFRPENVPFATKGISQQFKGLATLGSEISEKLSRALSWFIGDSNKPMKIESAEKKIELENALGDILKSLSWTEKAPAKTKTAGKPGHLNGEELGKLTALNRTGRVDYALPMGVFDISLVSAISAHVSYFEDKDTAGFIMKEVLDSGEGSVESKKVVLY